MSVCMSCNKPRVFSPKGLMSLAAHQMSDEVHGGGGQLQHIQHGRIHSQLKMYSD